jgi:signal transduction histidine kinase
MAPFSPLFKGYLIVTLIATVLALIVSTVISNFLVRPILSLKEGASRIGSGDFSYRIQPETTDELGDLATSFNYMAETLQERDRQINQYTQTLTDINDELKHKQDDLGRANEVLIKTNDELKKLERQKAEFTAMITHDIKSPLSTILTYSDMILSGTIPITEIDINKTMRNIFTSGHKILNLVENYLISSAIEAGRLHMNMSALNLPTFITEESEHFRPQFDKKGIDFSIISESDTPLVQADKMQLDRAFSNIITNAIKFTPVGGSIKVSTGLDGERVYVRIADTGKGISEDNIERIFGKYRRAEEAASVEGIGLGLFISNTIVEAHGGELTVSSTPGEGSVFTMYLPVGE